MSKRERDFVGEENHYRVWRVRGKAHQHDCIDCGGPAKEWSQVHGTDGQDVNDFEPRCLPCHRIYDHDARWGKPGYREQVSEGVKAAWQDGRLKAPEKLTEEHRRKISAANKGKERTPEQKEGARDRMRAWHSTPEGEAHAERRRAYYASPEGQAEVERQKTAHRERSRAWYASPEGKAFVEKRRQDRLSKLEGGSSR